MLLDLPIWFFDYIIFTIVAALFAYPLFFGLVFFEAILFAGEKGIYLNLFLSPLKLPIAMIPPLVYVVLPACLGLGFYNLIDDQTS